MTWTPETVAAAFRRAGAQPPADLGAVDKTAKYNSRKKVVDGITFDSAREARAYQQLKGEEALGAIRHLELQPRYLLQAAFRDTDGKHHRKIEYVADFRFDRFDGHWKHVVVDVKGFRTPVYRMKVKMFRAKYPDVIFEEWR